MPCAAEELEKLRASVGVNPRLEALTAENERLERQLDEQRRLESEIRSLHDELRSTSGSMMESRTDEEAEARVREEIQRLRASSRRVIEEGGTIE